MSTRVYKKDSVVAVAPFLIPGFDAPDSAPATGEMFDFVEAAAFEPFIEVAPEDDFATPEDVLQNARQEAAGIVAQAEKDKEVIEEAAREKAEREARLTIESEIEEKTREIRENLTRTIREVSVLRDEISERVENDVVVLALEVAKKIVGREVMFDREIALTLVRVSLKKINSRAPLAQIHLNPEDYAYVESRRDQIDFRGALELVEDDSISAGGCLVHTETGEVDARIESQFEEIAHGLLGK